MVNPLRYSGKHVMQRDNWNFEWLDSIHCLLTNSQGLIYTPTFGGKRRFQPYLLFQILMLIYMWSWFYKSALISVLIYFVLFNTIMFYFYYLKSCINSILSIGEIELKSSLLWLQSILMSKWSNNKLIKKKSLI